MHELEFKTKIEDVDIYGINNFLGTSKDWDIDTGAFINTKKYSLTKTKQQTKWKTKH